MMENNLVYRADSGGFHQHYGKENRVRNNIFAFADEGQIQRTRSEPHIPVLLRAEHRLLEQQEPGAGQLLGQPVPSSTTTSTGTRRASRSASSTTSSRTSSGSSKFGQDQHSIVADPLFVAPEKDDFRLKENSPALAIGFKPFDYSKAGRTRPRDADRRSAARAEGVRVKSPEATGGTLCEAQ